MTSLYNKFTIFLTFFCLISIHYCFSQQGQVTINQDRAITELLEAKKEMNKNNSDYYKIQIYSGDRSGAEKAQNLFNTTFDNWKSIDTYEPPNFKIWVGNFRTRLEADRALRKIKEEFPSAFIFKPKK